MTKHAPWLALLLLLAACTADPPPPAAAGETAAPAVTNRIDIPPAVVQNLGITFAKVERRRIEQTLRVPGFFESPPEARREYQAMLPGRVRLLVRQYQLVETGTPLFILEAPEWRRVQQELAAAHSAVTQLRAGLTVLESERTAARETLKLYPARIAAQQELLDASATHLARLQEARDHWQARVDELEELQRQGAGKASELAEARGQLKSALAGVAEETERGAEISEQGAALQAEQSEREQTLPVLESRIAAAGVEIANAEDAFQRALRAAAGTLGMPVETLSAGDAWRSLDTLTVTASAPGTIEQIRATTGAWVDANNELISTVDLTQLRFRARALQSDLGLLKNGLPARVVPPQGGTLEGAAPAEGLLYLPVEADPDERMLDLLAELDTPPAWARPGVSGELEVVWDATAEPVLALPTRAIVRDGLDMVFFVRDYKDPNKVIRTISVLGKSDGRWTEVESGVMEGSEVVIEGVYELKLTGGGKPLGEGHFHADGTWHAGKHSDSE
ncbi:MAG: efflux RND transporter periplasmic adaptor subunit [Planctomycetes bacterium]|nr:efflux RND transporter periplasmic adaptor subunit [Planctomycetota bacterium]MCB9935611.1 efflux RND transporter periplasmic adaptor subunit [Planctomycetota bacterium]